MARVNLQALKEEDEERKKKYVWQKSLTILGHKINEATKPKTFNRGERHG